MTEYCLIVKVMKPVVENSRNLLFIKTVRVISYETLGESSKLKRSDNLTFKVRAIVNTVLNVGFILAVSIRAI